MKRRNLLTLLASCPIAALSKPLALRDDPKFTICKLTYYKSCSAEFFYGSEKQVREFVHRSIERATLFGGFNFSFIIFDYEDKNKLKLIQDIVLNNKVKFCGRNFPMLKEPEWCIAGGVAGGIYKEKFIDRLLNQSFESFL